VEEEKAEAMRHRSQAEALSLQTAGQAQRLDEQQKALKAQAAELLRTTATPAAAPAAAATRPATAEPARAGANSSGRAALESSWGAGYTASALHAFPLSASSHSASARRAQIEETLANLSARLGAAGLPGGDAAAAPTRYSPHQAAAAPPAAPMYAFAECTDDPAAAAGAPAVAVGGEA